MNRAILGLALVAVSTGALSAQVQPKQFAVVTRLGTVSSDRASSLNSGQLLGLDTEYALNKWFGVGANIEVMRSNTRGEDYLTRLRYGNQGVGGGDSIYYQYVEQPVNTINIGAFGSVRYPSQRLSPFVMAGVGTYTLVPNTQVMGKALRKTDLSVTFGGGIWYKIADRVGVQLDARAMQMRNYDRNFFNPAFGRPEQITPFPEDFPTPPAAKNTALNTMFTLGFRYLPGGVGGSN